MQHSVLAASAVPNVETWHGVSVRISDAGRRGGERRRYMYKNEVRGQEQTTTGYFPMGRESDGSAKRVARTESAGSADRSSSVRKKDSSEVFRYDVLKGGFSG